MVLDFYILIGARPIYFSLIMVTFYKCGIIELSIKGTLRDECGGELQN